MSHTGDAKWWVVITEESGNEIAAKVVSWTTIFLFCILRHFPASHSKTCGIFLFYLIYVISLNLIVLISHRTFAQYCK